MDILSGMGIAMAWDNQSARGVHSHVRTPSPPYAAAVFGRRSGKGHVSRTAFLLFRAVIGGRHIHLAAGIQYFTLRDEHNSGDHFYPPCCVTDRTCSSSVGPQTQT